MLDKLQKSKLFFWTIELLAVVILIFFLTQISFLFVPVGIFFSTLFAPILGAGFLYYILNPIVTFMEKKLKIKRIISIILVFIVVIGAIVFSFISFIPNLIVQLVSFARSMPAIVRYFQEWLESLQRYQFFNSLGINEYISNLNLSWADIAKNTFENAANSLGSIFNVAGQVMILIGTVPFALFYMLKDGEKLIPVIEKILPENMEKTAIDLIKEMNKTIATYISGQAIECLFVFVMMFIGYLIMGLNYAFLFALIAGLCNLIPYIGPYLGLAPAFLSTVFVHPWQALAIIVLVVVVSQLDGNIVYPNVIGKKLRIHPLMIICLLLVGGSLAGLLGIFLAVPFYAICKTIVAFFISFYQVAREKEKLEKE